MPRRHDLDPDLRITTLSKQSAGQKVPKSLRKAAKLVLDAWDEYMMKHPEALCSSALLTVEALRSFL